MTVLVAIYFDLFKSALFSFYWFNQGIIQLPEAIQQKAGYLTGQPAFLFI
jgi:hypothetical protein